MRLLSLPTLLPPVEDLLRARSSPRAVADRQAQVSGGWWRVGLYAGFRFRSSLISDDATTLGVTCDFGSDQFRSCPVGSGSVED
jgi:hypothetical protein